MFKKERTVWITITSVLSALLLGFLFLSPVVLAKPNPEENNEAFVAYSTILDYLQGNYVDDIPTDKLIEGSVEGMFTSLNDPYSMYLNISGMTDIADTTSGEFGGLGLSITKRSLKQATAEDPAYVLVEGAFDGTPAQKAGIVAGDYISKINAQSVVEWTLDECVAHLRGKVGEKVTVTILRGKGLTFDLTMSRAIIEVPTVKYAMIPGNAAYLRIIQWTPHTAERVVEAIAFFKKNNFHSLVVDLRGDPGGLLSSVIQIADYFLSQGTIVSIKSRLWWNNKEFKADKEMLVDANIPMTVLIDKGSASASEIFAGCMKDNKRAKIVGSTSYGKGSVQDIIPLRNILDVDSTKPLSPTMKKLLDSGLRITTARYYTPSGINIDKIGIAPDVPVKEPELSDEELKSLQALFDQKLVANFVQTNPSANEAQIEDFLGRLKGKGINLSDRVVKKLIRDEQNRTNNTPPLFDLEYDLTLEEALSQMGVR